MATEYEWIVEEMEDSEIVDVSYCRNYSEARLSAGVNDQIALHKAVSGRNGDPQDLSVSTYAYVKNERLPLKFENGDAIPIRFVNEVFAQDKAKTVAIGPNEL